MNKFTFFLALAPLALVQSQVQAQTPAISNAAPLVRDSKAIAIFGQAVDAYKKTKSLSMVLQERNSNSGEIYNLDWAPPGKAALVIKRVGDGSDGRFVADGKNVYRLWPGAKVFDRIPMRDATDADGVLTASPLLLLGISPLIEGKNWAADPKIARGVTMGKIPAEDERELYEEELEGPIDVVRIQAPFPGDEPKKLTDFTYAFDKKTHHLQAIWMRLQKGNQTKTVSLRVQAEFFDTKPKAEKFIWKAPAGTKEVPFAGLFVAPPASTIEPKLEPAAIALLDKAAATYGSLKTLQMRVAGTG